MGKIKTHLDLILLFLIVVLSLFVRFYKISEIPSSLNWDEVSHGYNAFSILKTGKDEWGISFPLIFRAYGDFKLPLYIYLTTIPVSIFGLNGLSVRLISILSGVGLAVLSYLITKKITKNKTISFFAGFLTAVSPWSLFLSRIAVEANLGAFLFSLGGYFLVCWLDNPKNKYLFFSFLFWGLSLHAYNSCRIIVPLIVLSVIFVCFRKKLTRQLILPVMIFLFFFIPVIFQFLDKSGSARFEWVSLIDQGVINQINEKRTLTKLPSFVSKIVFNKLSFFAYLSIKNYLSNFSPNYLFFKGGSHYQFSQPNHELLYLITAPFLLLGFIISFFDCDKKKKMVIFWFLISFIPSAITKDAPHVLRSLLVLPTPMILSSLGLLWIVDFLKRGKSKTHGVLLITAVFIATAVSFGKWWKDYYNIYPKAYSWAWQYGYKDAVLFIKENYLKYNKIYLTKRYGEPHEFILFYSAYDPDKYQKDVSKKWDYHATWYWIDGFDKFEFINDWEIEGVKCEVGNEKCLLITSSGNYPEGWNKIKTINFLDGKPAFEILKSN